MIDPKTEESLSNAAHLISQARHLVVFTGAGVSVPSGIPDFRSNNTGFWQKSNPMEVASLTAFQNTPKRFFDWLRPLLQTSLKAQPNPAHTTLARMEKSGIVKSIITQNIDNLHQRSGSIRVIELHGSLSSFNCMKCGKQSPSTIKEIQIVLAGELPFCHDCRTILKPGIVLFEEQLPVSAWNKAEQQMNKADLVLILGSSLEVTPASSLPYNAYHNGAKIIIINFTPTYMDECADALIPIDVAIALPDLFERILAVRRN